MSPIYKIVNQDDTPLYQISKPNPNAEFWTMFYFKYAGHQIPPKRIEVGGLTHLRKFIKSVLTEKISLERFQRTHLRRAAVLDCLSLGGQRTKSRSGRHWVLVMRIVSNGLYAVHA